MRPVVSVSEMKDIDARAQGLLPLETLVERAGAAVARAALALLGSPYGRRVVVVAGKGHNGDDGRVAAARLRRRGVRTAVMEAAEAEGQPLPACDLVVDAAYGTGFRGHYRAPVVPRGATVLAVDIPSGVHGDTGEAEEDAVRASATVTFAALKPGLLLGEGRDRSGPVTVADIGLDVSGALAHLVEDSDVARRLPSPPRDAHKWQTAVYVAAGSPGMRGAAHLCSQAAMRAGAGMVRLGMPGAGPSDLPASEVVARALPATGWAGEVLAEIDRFRALVVGPGLGRGEEARAEVGRLVSEAPVPVLVDADGLNLLGSARDVAALASRRRAPLLLTPHDGEFSRLAGERPAADRLAAARDLARRAGATVLLKGSTTVVASPEAAPGPAAPLPPVLLSAAGSARLATAGTGDVLSGVIAAFLAQGLDALEAAALAAHTHGAASGLGHPRGLVAGDLLRLVPVWLSAVAGGRSESEAGPRG